MSMWNDLSWIENIRGPVLSVFFENITLLGYPTFLILFISGINFIFFGLIGEIIRIKNKDKD